MEELKQRDSSNKVKRTRFEQVKQIATAYLQRRNYPVISNENVPIEEFKMSCEIENEINRPNSILYSCFNNDPNVIDQTFSKFLLWIKDLLKNNKNKHDDIEFVVGPLFCHIYLEILRGGHTDRAANFIKMYLPLIDKNKCDGLVQELINAFASDIAEVSMLKDSFRSNKYAVELSSESVKVLKNFLAEAGHVVLLQVFQSWFSIVENDDVREEVEQENTIVRSDKILCNGHVENSKTSSVSMQKLLNAIENVKLKPAPIYSVNISNVKDEVTCGMLNRNHGIFAYSYNNTVIIRSLETLQQLQNVLTYGEAVFLGHTSRIYDLAFFKNHKHLISASQDKTIQMFDLENYDQNTVYKGHEYPVYCLSTSNNGNYFASGSYDRTGRLWSVSRKDTLRVFIGHTQQVTSVDFHSNCTYVATGSADKNIRMWSIKDAEPTRLLLGSKGAVYALNFTPKGKYLISSGEDSKLRIWDLISAKQLLEFKVGSHPVMKIAISEDENMLATGSIDGCVKTWNLDSLIKNSGDVSAIEPIVSLSLNPNLLSLDYCFDTFGCLTCQWNATGKL